MNSLIQNIINAIIIVLVILGLGLLVKNKYSLTVQTEEKIPSKTLALKKYLLNHEKPQRIEIVGLSDRFSKDISDIKKLKVSQDLNSDFYITIQLFSDEEDKAAPLIAQIRFVDLKTGNLKKEESINLE
ncbi:MAG: hypothetical protein WA160_16305 [Pseudobdellovibrio sp.]